MCSREGLPAKHAARLVGGSTAPKAGEEEEEAEEDEADDDEGEVGGIAGVLL